MELPYVTLVLKPSAAQQADLDQLLAQRQDPSSPSYHRWLTPEQYADRFGVSQADIGKIVAWLGGHDLTLKSVARGRNAIAFAGAASQIESAFRIQLHHYLVGGELHYANTADPTVPVAFQDVAGAIRGLHDFRLKPMLRRSAQPRYTLEGFHYLAPDDVATIYDITPLYTAGYDGTGQTLAIVGQTEINLSDIQEFQSYFNLPLNNPTTTLIPGSPNPGIQEKSGDLAESDLDLELSGAVARNATILFVYASDVVSALQYAIDQNVAPVISTSYGSCESLTLSSEVQSLQAFATQANMQGITVFAAAGDSGAADCFDPTYSSTDNLPASVDMPASLPQVTGVGGTEFNDRSGSYWSAANTKNNASALSYIPEIVWNDSVHDGSPSASGGGVSIYFSKPIWQTATGVPNDGARDVPDVSISASADHDGYYIHTGGSFQVFGGTSAGPPQFAGIAALLNQYLVKNGFQPNPGLGNINQTLYAAAQIAGLFHDITSGNNTVIPCTQPCSVPAVAGYSAGPGYDRVTGLGTPDVDKLVTSWHAAVISKSSPSMTLSPNPSSLAFTGNTDLTATVSGSGAAPTGQVAFLLGSYSLGEATLSPSSNGVSAASLTLGGLLLAAGANSITAEYFGDSSYYGTTAAASVTVTSATSSGPPTINANGVLNAASFTTSLAPGGILSIFGTNLAPPNVTGGAPSIPLPAAMAGTTVTINGYAAPLYYVSDTQLNVQIPYGLATNFPVQMRIDNNGQHITSDFRISATAPAIFATNSQGTGQGAILNTSYQLADSSHPATPGSTYLLIYGTGLGAVSNPPAAGAPALSSPLSQTGTLPQVTIGNVQTTAAFSGLAPGYAGLYQVNVLVPASVAAGSAVPVWISIGGANSNTVTIAVAP